MLKQAEKKMHPLVNRIQSLSLVAVVTTTLLTLSACTDNTTAPTNVAAVATVGAQACLQLTGLTIAANNIGLPTTGATIISAELIAATAENNTNGEYCKVLGAIHPATYTAPDINFEVNLPSTWNQKSIQFGGGGLNGNVVSGLGFYAKQPATEATPLARGYVTLGSDSGHKSAGGFDGSFYLNAEALENFGRLQIKKTHDVAMWLVSQYYSAAPQYNYFIGGSQGGHEGFDAVQRYPADYDGVIAGYPAHNVVMLHLSALNLAKALQANDGQSWLNPREVEFLTTAVYTACDTLDGAADGIISNVAACTEATAPFKLTTAENPLRCANGKDSGEQCLSDFQLQALNNIDTPYDAGMKIFNDDEGNAVFPKWTPFEGSTFLDGGFPNLGAERPQQALQFAPGDATTRLAIAQNIKLDVINDFDPAQYAGRINELTLLMSANSIALEPFRAKGGKLIYFHGLVDDYISPYSSIQYYNRLLTRFGQENLDSFVSFYTIPGMGHQTGVFNARLSTLEALENWVEKDQAPGELLATDVNTNTAGRTRPVCKYPLWPRYRGEGDLNLAASFECVAQ